MIFHMAYADPKSEHVTDIVAVDESCTTDGLKPYDVRQRYQPLKTIRTRTYLNHAAAVLAHRVIFLSNLETPQ